MCIERLVQTEGYELEARMSRLPTGDTNLSLYTYIPHARHPEYHRVLQLNLPQSAIKKLGRFLCNEA